MPTETYVLQTYYWGNNGLEQRGYSREFKTLAQAEEYAINNMTGSRYTITSTVNR